MRRRAQALKLTVLLEAPVEGQLEAPGAPAAHCPLARRGRLWRDRPRRGRVGSVWRAATDFGRGRGVLSCRRGQPSSHTQRPGGAYCDEAVSRFYFSGASGSARFRPGPAGPTNLEHAALATGRRLSVGCRIGRGVGCCVGCAARRAKGWMAGLTTRCERTRGQPGQHSAGVPQCVKLLAVPPGKQPVPARHRG